MLLFSMFRDSGISVFRFFPFEIPRQTNAVIPIYYALCIMHYALCIVHYFHPPPAPSLLREGETMRIEFNS